MRRWVAAVAALLLAVSACGGSDEAASQDDASSGGGSTTTIAATPAAGGGDQAGDDSSSGGTPSDDGASGDDQGAAAVSGIGRGSVTINGETYYFGETSFPALQCNPNLFGVFFVVLQMVDEQGNEIPGGGGLQLVLLQEGSDPEELDQRNEARVAIEALDQEWIADEEDIAERSLEAGTSQVDSYTIDGSRATGTATFYEENSYWASVGDASNAVNVTEGTFEVTCAG
jgi:hypothetical protein